MSTIRVTWVDAQADAEHWTSADELEHTPPRVIRTVGYDLGPRIDGHVSLAASWDVGADTYGHVMHIPLTCVTERVTLTAGA